MFKEGYIASGILKFSKKVLSEYKFNRKIEYKYLLKKCDESDYFPEFLGSKEKNRKFSFDYQMNTGNYIESVSVTPHLFETFTNIEIM